MRDFAKVAPSLWRSSKKFRDLPDDRARLAYLYILTSPHSNSAGCYHLPVLYACADLGWPQEDFTYALDALIVAELIDYDWTEEVIFVECWFTKSNPPANSKHVLGIINQVIRVPGDKLVQKCLAALAKVYYSNNWNASDSISKGIENVLGTVKSNPIDTVSNQRDRDRDTETESKTETKTKAPSGEAKSKPRGSGVENNNIIKNKPPRASARGKGLSTTQPPKEVSDGPAPASVPAAGPSQGEEPIASVELEGEDDHVPDGIGPLPDPGEIPAFLDRRPAVGAPATNELLDALESTERLRKAAAGRR